ncbi:MAG: hypothetical protein FWE72_00760 [Spirochaetaceae bacterium]|nr:hypothetical protein [Spirochaetaceae bacterium]
MINIFSKNKKHYPFEEMYQKLSPKDFYAIFRNEAYQTITFLLSFSRSKQYVKKALKLWKDVEVEQVYQDYVKKPKDEKPDAEFVKSIEEYLSIKIKEV